MQIDFDNFRRKGVEAYNRLCAELNGRVHNDSTISDSRSRSDALCVGDIRDEMDALRDCIVTLICLEDRRDGIERLDLEVYEFAPGK
jgi:hypothetical protein